MWNWLSFSAGSVLSSLRADEPYKFYWLDRDNAINWSFPELHASYSAGNAYLYFDDGGNLSIATDYNEDDFLYDEIGSGLKVNQLRNEKRELFEQLEEYYELLIIMNGGSSQ